MSFNVQESLYGMSVWLPMYIHYANRTVHRFHTHTIIGYNGPSFHWDILSRQGMSVIRYCCCCETAVRRRKSLETLEHTCTAPRFTSPNGTLAFPWFIPFEIGSPGKTRNDTGLVLQLNLIRQKNEILYEIRSWPFTVVWMSCIPHPHRHCGRPFSSRTTVLFSPSSLFVWQKKDRRTCRMLSLSCVRPPSPPLCIKYSPSGRLIGGIYWLACPSCTSVPQVPATVWTPCGYLALDIWQRLSHLETFL